MKPSVSDVSVGLGEAFFSGDPEAVMIVHGLGSCIGLVLYDRKRRCGGLCHIVLPRANNGQAAVTPARFADAAVPYAIDQMRKYGSGVRDLEAKITGGASLFNTGGISVLNIGENNIGAVTQALSQANVRLAATEVGGTLGRTMKFFLADGRVEVSTIAAAARIL